MPIQDFQQQSLRAMQMGGQLGSALQNAQSLQLQRQAQQQEQSYLSELRPLQIQQQQMQVERMQKEDTMKDLTQTASMLAYYDEETGKQIIPQFIDKYKDNPGVVAGLEELYKKSGKEYTATALMMLSAASGKPIGGDKRTTEQKDFDSLTAELSDKDKLIAKKVKLGLLPRAVGNAVTTAMNAGEIESLADAKALIKEHESFAAATGASRVKTIDKGFASINKIDAGISNIDRALSALAGGAGTGAIEKWLPSIKAASVELDNVRGSMALDVVGATTFGALSKGELDLAKDIALPTGLNEPEMTDYLNRKKSAQQKVRGYYNEQIQHLDQGGTVASFLRQKENETGLSTKPGAPIEQPGALEQPTAAVTPPVQYTEGMTATGPNGEKMKFINGQWVNQ